LQFKVICKRKYWQGAGNIRDEGQLHIDGETGMSNKLLNVVLKQVEEQIALIIKTLERILKWTVSLQEAESRKQIGGGGGGTETWQRNL